MNTRIVDLSLPFGVDTPLWPFPGPRQDLIFQRGEYLERFHKRSVVYTGTLHAGTHMDAPIHVLHPEEGGIPLDKILLENCYGTGIVAAFSFRCELADGGMVRLVAICEELNRKH